jgi:hypothetical protein
MCC